MTGEIIAENLPYIWVLESKFRPMYKILNEKKAFVKIRCRRQGFISCTFLHWVLWHVIKREFYSWADEEVLDASLSRLNGCSEYKAITDAGNLLFSVMMPRVDLAESVGSD